MATTKAKTKKELREAKQRTLKSFYATLEIRRQWQQTGDTRMVATADDILCQCLERLWILRGQEVLTWPLLLPAAPCLS